MSTILDKYEQMNIEEEIAMEQEFYKTLRKTVKLTADNGAQWVTSINGSAQYAINYFLGKTFNIGVEDDLMVKVINVEVL